MTLRSVVAFFTHPGDETVLAGGMLTLLSKMRIQTHIVCATRGEGGETGTIPLPQIEIGRVHEGELRCAAQKLGATVEVLGYVDPVIGADDVLFPFQADFNVLTRQIIEIIRARSASLVLTHGAGGEYGHPAHQLLYRAVVTAVQQVYPAVLLYSVAATVPEVEDRIWNQNEIAHFALDIRPWLEEKSAAMECHTSQHNLSMRRRGLQSPRERVQTIEAVRRVLPETHRETPDDAFAQLLRTAGAWIPEQRL